MVFRKSWQKIAFGLGIGWSLVWSIIFSDIPLIQKLELNIQDRLICLTHPHTPPPEILLVKITEKDLRQWGLQKEPVFYAKLVNQLIEEGASVVILNLLPNWVQTSDHANNPIKELVKTHPTQIVLVIPTTRLSSPYPTAWRSYNYFIPFDAQGKPLKPLNSVLGFSEYEPDAKNPTSLISPARQAHISGELILSEDFSQTQILDSAAWLALKKFQLPNQTPNQFAQTPIQITFWGATNTFPTLNIQSFFTENYPHIEVRHKIVLVGLADVNNPDAYAIKSPFGEEMPGVELQANLLASIITNSYYSIAPRWLETLIAIAGGILISRGIVLEMLKLNYPRQFWILLLPLGIFSGLFILSIIGLAIRLIFPITLLLFTWSATVISVILCMRFGLREDFIRQQQCEITRLTSVEQEAAISQARKLLHRIASNIHDGPLQELKLIMDDLEVLQMNQPHLNIDPLLDKLEDMGEHLRQHLNQTRTLALAITPELREGLDVGIEKKLQELVNTQELTLNVIKNIQPLEEPEVSSLWMEAREDIFRFFCEGIANVIHHAQMPAGKATQVKVILSQHQTQCTLIVENDGSQLNHTPFNSSPPQRKRGGYGIKLMETIAAELPGGRMERSILADGGMRVTLTWNLLFNVA